MDLGLQGKVALVTAASEGLGFACAARFARAGCKVAICARRLDALASARDRLSASGGGDVLAVPADVADATDIEDLVKRVLADFGRLDILVVNSGHIAYGGLEDLTDEQWEHAYNLLLMSAVRLARLCVPAMRAGKGGDIVFLGSATTREPPPHLLLSTVMRLGVAALAKTLSRALAPDNIRVNLVAPGYFDTGRVHARVEELKREKALSQRAAEAEISGGVPIGRIGSADELAELVAFVASRKAGFMTGATICIDGGGSHAPF
jgi:3-oxoacyl-[acyl-carrier protein] reductase